MLIILSLISFGVIFFTSKLLHYDSQDTKLIFISIFTLLMGIGIALLVANGHDNFSFSVRCVSCSFIMYGFSSGIQYIRRK